MFYQWCKKNEITTVFTHKVNHNNELEKLFENNDSLFLKPNYSMQGKGCHILNGSYFRNIGVDIDYNGWIAQKVVQQHPNLRALNESSLNTLRVHTCKLKDGSDVDNVSSGGYYVPFDFYEWKTYSRAYSDFDSRRISIDKHPINQSNTFF